VIDDSPIYRLDEIEDGSLSWVYDGYLARGIVTLVVGSRRKGKITV
jgi:hypothetical protein